MQGHLAGHVIDTHDVQELSREKCNMCVTEGSERIRVGSKPYAVCFIRRSPSALTLEFPSSLRIIRNRTDESILCVNMLGSPA